MEDESFAKMMETREAAKIRGYPSGFQKSQCLGGAKPGNMGRDKDWPMPANIPKGKSNEDTKSSEIKKSEDGTYSFRDLMAIKKMSGNASEGYNPKKQDSKSPSLKTAQENAKKVKEAEKKTGERDALKQKKTEKGRSGEDVEEEKAADEKTKKEEEKGRKEATESNAKTEDRVPEYKRKKETEERKAKKEKNDQIRADKIKDAEDEEQAVDSGENASEMAGDYNIPSYGEDETNEEIADENPTGDDYPPEPGTMIIDPDTGEPREYTFEEYADALNSMGLPRVVVDRMLESKLPHEPDDPANPPKGRYYSKWTPWTKDDMLMDQWEAEDRANAAEAKRNHKYFGDWADTARQISRGTGKPVQMALMPDVVRADTSKMGTRYPKAGPKAMNMRGPKTEQTRLIDGNMVSSKGVTPLGGEKGGKNTGNKNGKPPLMQTDLTQGENSVFGNSPKQSLDRETDIRAIGGGIPSFRDLLQDRSLQGVESRKSLVDSTLSDRATKPLLGGSSGKTHRRIGGPESSASNKNSRYKNIDRTTERKPTPYSMSNIGKDYSALSSALNKEFNNS